MAGTIVAYGRWLAAWELGEDGGVCPVLCSGRNIGMQGKQKEHRWEPGTQPDRHSSKACKDREGVVSSQTARTARIMLAMPCHAMGHGSLCRRDATSSPPAARRRPAPASALILHVASISSSRRSGSKATEHNSRRPDRTGPLLQTAAVNIPSSDTLVRL